jgi:hypothetical protein
MKVKALPQKIPQFKNHQFKPVYWAFWIFAALVIYLFYWAVQSGFFYMFDADELMNMHMAYLISTGWHTFSQYFSVYSPVFHWFLTPIFSLMGYGYGALILSRYVMILLFFIRVILSTYLVYKIFGKLTAAVFLIFFLADPFTQFTAMQVRPDNLMMVFLTAALCGTAILSTWGSRKVAIFTGLFTGLSAITMIKTIPQLAVILALVTFISVRKSRSVYLKQFLIGSMIAPLLFLLIHLFNGTTSQMFQQLFIDAPLTNLTRNFPPRPWSLYLPENAFLFGFIGRPVSWLFALVLPMTGLAGFFRYLMDEENRKKADDKYYLALGLVVIMLVGFITIVNVKAVFIQYYLPVTWLYAVGTALFAVDLYDLCRKLSSPGSWIGIACLIFIMIGIYRGAVRANMARSLFRDPAEQSLEKVWALIPPNAAVFPGYLFRPPAHPVGYGYFFPETPKIILNRYPSVIDTLEKGKVKYAFISDYMLSLMDYPTHQYVQSKYHRLAGYQDLLIRN